MDTVISASLEENVQPFKKEMETFMATGMQMEPQVSVFRLHW